jgi:hypothetical protein
MSLATARSCAKSQDSYGKLNGVDREGSPYSGASIQ